MRTTKYMGFMCWNHWVGYYNILGYIHWHRKDMDRKYMDNELKSKLYKK